MKRPSVKPPRVVKAAHERAGSAVKRGGEWVEQQDPASKRGTAIDAWKRYQAVDGPLQSLLISTYLLIAVIPALLVLDEYLERNPQAFANHLVRHYGLSSGTSALIHSVLVQDRHHELGSALLAIAGALFFGLGFGRVLQLVHVRAWGLPPPSRNADQPRYALVLLGLYGLIFLLMIQLKELAGAGSWARLLIAPGWVAVLALYFLWVGRVLTHKQLTRRDLLPGAALTGVGLVAVMLVSSLVMDLWVNFYARDYGGLGVVMAVFFWIGFSSAIVVMASALSPALAQRRELRRAVVPQPTS